MDVIKIRNKTLIHSYKGGLKISSMDDLVAIECDKPFIRLIFKNEKVLIRGTLKTIEIQLQNHFVRISRQIIVNMLLISEFVLKNGAYWLYYQKELEYKVSERKEKAVREAFLSYLTDDSK